ncbi:MAG: cobalamin-dependent protein [Propionibacteriaceae bacterium]|nr:cobalamin-dependent protein [Propionibacteriaceae bacterium]
MSQAASGRASARGAARRSPDLVSAATSLNSANLADVLDRALKFASLDSVLDKWLMPELERLGQAWADDEVTVAQEHFASAGVSRALGRAFDAVPDSLAPDVLVGLPEGSRHELGLQAFSVCLRRQRGGVVYLGSDVPVSDWESTARAIKPKGVVIGVPQCSEVAKAQEIVNRLTAEHPDLRVWVGGSLASEVRGATQLPNRLAEAAEEVATALR